MIPDEVARFAEDATALSPEPRPGGGFERILGDRYCILFGPAFTTVSRLRLAADGVEAAVAEVRGLTAGRPWPTSWWIGGFATPAGLAEGLLALGLRRATDPSWEPVATAMATVTAPPEGSPHVATRRVETYDEFVRANELEWDVFEADPDDRARQEALLPERWPAERSGDAPAVYLAWVDGEPAGVGRALYFPQGTILLGGAVLPAFRGRGVYRALVRARWDESCARGTPALTVVAGAMSRPTLERLGFEPVSRIEILLDGP